MSIKGIRVLVLTLCSAALVSFAGLNVPRDRSVEAKDRAESKLQQLQREKVDVLQEDVAHLEKLHDMGQAGFEELYSAHLALHKAQLDLCDSNQARIAVLEKLLSEAKRREEAVKALNDVSSIIAKHRARVDRLDVEIQLEQLRNAR